MEGNVYLCYWKKEHGQYNLSLKKHPDVSVSGETFQSAEEKLWELICLKLGVGEAVLEYEPSPPVNSLIQGYETPAIVSISGNDTVDAPRQTLGLFTKDYCPTCTRAWGERTKTELEVGSLPSKSDGAICMSIPGLGEIFSQTFLCLLSERERNQFTLLKVKTKKPCKQEFFELIGSPVAQFVGLSGLPGFNTHPCTHCRYQPQSHLFENKIYNFLALEDLPTPIPNVFSVGHRGANVCMIADHWQSLQGKAGTRNLVARRIYVIPNKKAQRIGA
jgi:hypothetical protein